MQETRPKEFDAFESIRIYQSVQSNHWGLPGGAGNSQRSRCTDWQIGIDSSASNSFGVVSCTDHVDKPLLWISGSPFYGQVWKD